ncbi:conserved hypothetical protein [Bathymodiolus platifrons methanotrophic gill symbiont]|uniref:penicillin-binding protein activator n=1 Tax=Bathymodiolus platifrons methanotrophic gill symbiont TaxID=113268 RepID=UPI000B414FF2|nr:penicillin-binding protein activator [Bathymodiolus platifrons methanotrophic gill symbiont]MCK5869264.1 penicillin-binding protein activator [Methyloprofundus sp.]TXK98428.1 LppC family lipoprotein [Methylococcaceae bacterium CS4]TXL00986.1 LppC family lipoprotein [Methylococcaceae bacterium CS5]TXL07050.1 LppC family lipoprotein [Methylococcaceae bacterium CS1]TXL08332.1 LppC family lipoprotein [Methylococcaceae bacterium CS3]TXL11110.1 LppC family lipoprotein [Methylococcaceae bacterium
MKRYTEQILKSQDIIKFSLLSVLLLISACSLQTGGLGSSAGKESVEERKAGQLFVQGDYSEAALLYQRLAQQISVRQNILRLKAAQAFLKIPLDDQAKINLDLISVKNLTGEQLNHLNLMYAQLDLNSGNIEQALDYLMRISVSALSHSEKTTYYEMTAFAYALSGEIVKSVRERIALDLYQHSGQKKESNNRAILELLSLMSEQTLQRQRTQPQTSTVYSGWLALEQVRRNFPSGEQQQQALNEWADQYPRHPAQPLIASGYFLVSGIKLGNVRDIALFLPGSGPYGLHANALKAGFMAAYERQAVAGVQPNIHFYDTQQSSISVLYDRAVADGVQLVIGPLNKKYIQELAGSRELIVPVMALNYVEGLAKTNLYQFALSPIDEVRQAVSQARFSGHENAIILVPATANGERVSQYFQNAWEAVNGNIIQVQMFDSAARDFSFPVRQMLNINESEYRSQRLQKVIGTAGYESRRRQDVDVIFLAASNQKARLINPQFYHNRAGSVTVYGLSQVYKGQADKNQDIDLEGINFCTIPWLFDEAFQGELSMSALQDLQVQFPNGYLSLVAFGIDAYAVIAHLNDLGSISYKGATGDLLLNENNRIERHLVCAEFKDGAAVLVEMAEESMEEPAATMPNSL